MTVDGVLDQFWSIVLDKRALRVALIVLSGAVILAAGVGAYSWYTTRREERAQVLFAQCLASFASEDWKRIAQAFHAGYEKASSSVLAPYFLAYAADAEYAAGDEAAAQKSMDTAVSLLSQSSPIYYLIVSKRALLKADSSDATVREAALRELQELAQSARNPYKDIALYYRGLSAYQSGDFEGAKASWFRLIREYGNDSLWSEPARTRLTLLP